MKWQKLYQDPQKKEKSCLPTKYAGQKLSAVNKKMFVSFVRILFRTRFESHFATSKISAAQKNYQSQAG